MSYEALTLAKFVDRLRLNMYRNAAAARRGLERGALSPEDQARALELIETTFKRCPTCGKRQAVCEEDADLAADEEVEVLEAFVGNAQMAQKNVDAILAALASHREADREADREVRELPLGVWQQTVSYGEAVRGKTCIVALETRAGWCDRGRFLAKVFPDPGSELALSLDEQDGWPRYYFDKKRAQLEVEAWLKRRGQL